MSKYLIAAFSDIHGTLPSVIDCCDIVCICGDIFPQNIERDIEASKKWFEGIFLPWTQNLPCDIIIMIPGNHCFYLEAVYHQHKKIIIPTTYSGKCVCLVDESFIYRDIKFYGTPWITNLPRWAFNTDTPISVFDKIPYNCDILLTHHAPNYGKLGCSYPNTANEKNYGCDELCHVINLRPHIRYHFCGHIHTGLHGGVKIGNTMSYNVSILDEQYHPGFPITYIEYLN